MALPLEAINAAGRAEKSVPRKGSPATMHLWWSRKPLGVCRAVLFASLVDDPSAHPERFPTDDDQRRERARLFSIVDALASWKAPSDEGLLARARAELQASCPGGPPAILDPFCGGGSIPLEAGRLGLRAVGGDLNPVAVLISKCVTELPARFAGLGPVNPDRTQPCLARPGQGAAGLAEDVRHYGGRVQAEAWRRIGRLYPPATLTGPGGGRETPVVVSWLWARTARCPNPACGADMPLVSQWWLSKGERRTAAYVRPIDRPGEPVSFEVVIGDREGVPAPVKVGRGASFRCVSCGSVAPAAHVKAEGTAGRLGLRLLAIQALAKPGTKRPGRVFLDADRAHEALALACPPPEPNRSSTLDGAAGNMAAFGFDTFDSLSTNRQRTALATFSTVIGDLHPEVRAAAAATGLDGDDGRLCAGGRGALAYADAVVTLLAVALSSMANRTSSMTIHNRANGSVEQSFVQPAYAFYGDFPEANPFSGSTGSWAGSLERVWKAVAAAPAGASPEARIERASATALDPGEPVVISTDLPYYDMFDYAALSDYFYAWLRPTLRLIWPEVCAPLAAPVDEQVGAYPARYGGDRRRAAAAFESALGAVFRHLRERAHPGFPLTVYYGYQQAEHTADGRVSTAWETMLSALLHAGFRVVATWPLRTERPEGVKSGSSSLASSIALVCRPRPDDAPLATRRDLLTALEAELPGAVRTLQSGDIAPVDLAQAAIGPGMAVFSRYARVIEADGSTMSVRTALGLVNAVLDETLSEQEGDFDADTRWALAWFEETGLQPGPYGRAETLSKAKNTSVTGLVAAGVVESKAGTVRLLDRSQFSEPWDPAADARLAVWAVTQHLVKAIESGGQARAAELLARVGSLGETARGLAYRLYSTCERKRWAREALAYNALVRAWPEIARLAAGPPAGARPPGAGKSWPAPGAEDHRAADGGAPSLPGGRERYRRRGAADAHDARGAGRPA